MSDHRTVLASLCRWFQHQYFDRPPANHITLSFVEGAETPQIYGNCMLVSLGYLAQHYPGSYARVVGYMLTSDVELMSAAEHERLVYTYH